jgi:ankyrin repeat protein
VSCFALQWGFTALMRAATNGHTLVVEALVAANADVNARSHVSRVYLNVRTAAD